MARTGRAALYNLVLEGMSYGIGAEESVRLPRRSTTPTPRRAAAGKAIIKMRSDRDMMGASIGGSVGMRKAAAGGGGFAAGA